MCVLHYEHCMLTISKYSSWISTVDFSFNIVIQFLFAIWYVSPFNILSDAFISF